MIKSTANRPQIEIPLNDWHFQDEARQAIYAGLPEMLSAHEHEFTPLENGILKEV